jgi:hypothetical protein
VKALACCLLLLCISSFGQDFFGESPRTKGYPLEQLPKHIKPALGKVSLFADFERPSIDGSIPVYLINAGIKEVTLRDQDGDVYLKLEALDAKGSWVRAQPHAYSWCGNSYSAVKIRSGQFFEIHGYQPTNRIKYQIRFSLHQQDLELSSNIGTGFVAPRDIDRASHDAMAVREGSFEFVRKLALGELKLENEMDHIKDLQGYAISQLQNEPFDSIQSRDVLVRVLKKFPERKKEVEFAILRLDIRDTAVSPDAEKLSHEARRADASNVLFQTRPRTISETTKTVKFTGKGRQRLMSKLEGIRLDKISYDAKPLGEVIVSLQNQVKKADPEKLGLNILVNPNPVSPDQTNTDISTVTITIDPPLNDVRVIDALEAIMKVANQPIKYRVGDYAVEIGWSTSEDRLRETRGFKVDPNTFRQGLEGVSPTRLPSQ